MPLFLNILWQQTQNDTEFRLKAFEGLRKYQEARRYRRTIDATVAATAGAARLLHYGGAGKPVVFVPSLINPHIILDLSDHNSLLRFLSKQGWNVYLVDWGSPRAGDRDLDLAGHVEHRLLPMLRALPEPPVLIGYCLGGTMAVAAAGLIETAALAMIAAPWDFASLPAGYGELVANLWASAQALCERLGFVPMEVLQSGFWALDPQRTIRKYADFASLPSDSEAEQNFIVLEDWANEGAPLTLGAGRELFERLYGANDTGAGKWTVGRKIADPAALDIPFLNILSDTDKIVPAQASCHAGKKLHLRSGHVGMIVGREAREQLWVPLAEWLLESISR